MALHLLVVDDDEDVRSTLVDLLLERGFSVTSTGSGASMREILACNGPAFDGVVLDWGMPGEPTSQLALHTQSLGLPLVMISGGVDAIEFADEKGLQMLPKPFRMEQLLDALAAAIARDKSDRGTA